MNKKFLSAILFGALAVASTGSFVSCKDYDDDIDNLQSQINQLATKSDLQSSVSTLQGAVATAQSAAENKAAAAQAAADKAAADAKAAVEAGAKATDEAAKAAAAAAEAKAAAEAAAAQEDLEAAEAKIAALEAAAKEVAELAATLVKTEDFEAAKAELNKKYAELEAKVGQTTGTTGLLGLQVLTQRTDDKAIINASYGVWDGVHEGAKAAEWKGPKAAEVAALKKGELVSVFGTPTLEIAVNPTDINVENTEFAVVNKYGDVAPIAFGTPKVLTRANGAGSYTVQLKSAATTGAAIAAFAEKFNDANGKTGALVAGKISSQYTANFVSITKALNADKSAFSAEVKYDEISGSVELVAAEAEKVLDAYIVKLVAGPSVPADLAHDSLLWAIQYDGLTLTYNAEAAKKLAVDADQTFTVSVAQINPNGYIHTVNGTVTFVKKAPAESIKKEVELPAITHAVQLKAKNPLTDEDLQIVKFTKNDLLKALGYKKGSEDSIHFAHSTLKAAVEITDAYIYTNENDPVHFTKTGNAFAFGNASVAGGVMTLKFKEGYDSANKGAAFTVGGTDVVAKSEKMYVVMKVKAVDSKDVDGEVETEYTVTLPIKFQWVDVESLYSWKKDVNPAANIENAIKIENPALTYNQGTFARVPKDATKAFEYWAPSMSAELDVDNNKNYKELLAAIEEQEIGEGKPYATKTAKDAAKALLKERFSTLVSVNDVEYVYSTATVGGYWKGTASSTTENTTKINSITTSSITITGLYTCSLGDTYSYTIKGLKGEVLGREVSLANHKVDVAPVVTPTATMTTTAAKLTELTFLSNSTAKPADATNFAGTFTLKAEDGKILNLKDDQSSFSTPTMEFVDADDKAVAPGTATVTMKVLEYAIDAENYAYGIQIEAKNIPETAKKVKLTFNVNGVVYHSTSQDAPDQTGVVAEFAL